MIPRSALLRGKPVQVLSYDGNGYFTVLERDDSRMFVPRERLVFTK